MGEVGERDKRQMDGNLRETRRTVGVGDKETEEREIRVTDRCQS